MLSVNKKNCQILILRNYQKLSLSMKKCPVNRFFNEEKKLEVTYTQGQNKGHIWWKSWDIKNKVLVAKITFYKSNISISL